MASKKSPLKIVLSKFPEQALLIKELFVVSESFRSLCEDYADCLNVIKDLDCYSQMLQKGYKNEYEVLLLELEEEVFSRLNQENDSEWKRLQIIL